MSKTKIEWCQHVYNPVTGCSKISEGCQNCYAFSMNKRFGDKWNNPDFKVRFHPERLNQPLRKKKPTLYFVCSMGDLFHEDVEIEWLKDIFNVISMSPQHHFLMLTKRPLVMKLKLENLSQMIRREMAKEGFSPFNYKKNEFDTYRNLWLGVTAENQEQADKRIPILLDIPAAGHFVSFEPLLEWINIKPEWSELKWSIVGGENSNTNPRDMSESFVYNIYKESEKMNIPFFFKKWGTVREREGYGKNVKKEYPRQVPEELARFFI